VAERQVEQIRPPVRPLEDGAVALQVADAMGDGKFQMGLAFVFIQSGIVSVDSFNPRPIGPGGRG
jgi:hypothetical protein